MTRDQAIELAQAFVLDQGLAVTSLHPHAVRHMRAEDFNELYGYHRYESDFWVVEFWKQLPRGVAAETPATVTVEVLEKNGQVQKVFPGM